ncbi:hypothetical protein BC936DRAFT_145479 [Jimgerdemannia flammicorona]|uniref:Uncharacterized protein n=1 Tax=Jimgerdemannia flammicorona TaxID=994334 RepID=A0A433D9V8_9FUNG|nr:hypothetical protein BC936DRAFT_145479 [Jimgerdemannia flammicorona]
MKMETILHDLNLSRLDEEVIASLCNQMCEAEDVVYQNCVTFLQSTLLVKVSVFDFLSNFQHAIDQSGVNRQRFPFLIYKVRELTTAPSRILITSILNASKAKGKAVVDGLLLPLVHGDDVGRPQIDVATRAINEGLNEMATLALLR